MKLLVHVAIAALFASLSACSSPLPPVAHADIAALTADAEVGNPHALNELGARYQNGDGVPKDLGRALALYRKASDAGNAAAEFNLGYMYDLGTGVPQDRKVANEWYLKSANQGYAPAMLNVGMNIAGGVGVTQDWIEGMKWIDLARFFTQFDKDMNAKWTIRRAYDQLKQMTGKEDFEEAQRRSRAWYEAFKARGEKG
jgi:hypothetical protein